MIKNTFSARDIFKDIRNFLVGRFLGATRDEFFLEEIVKLIFCKFTIDCNTAEISDIELFELYQEVFHSVVESHSDIYPAADTKIELDEVCVKYIDDKFNELDFNNLNRDLIGDAYEIFIGETIKGQAAQFFTPQNAANTLVEMIQPSPSDKILDLTCGAGSFLIATLKYWLDHQEKAELGHLFGVDKDEYLVRLCKIHIACMNYNTDGIKCADSLLWDENILGKGADSYDAILTNFPYGAKIRTEPEILSKFSLAYKEKKTKKGEIQKSLVTSTPPQIVFTEQCIKLTKPNGWIGLVVPESLLCGKKYSETAKYILDTCYVRAVVGMPEALFKVSGKGGTHTKTCLLVLQKRPDIAPYENYNIFMAEAKWCGHDSRGREIPKDDLIQIVQNYKDYKGGKELQPGSLGFVIKSQDIKNNVLAPRTYLDSENIINTPDNKYYLVTIKQLVDEGVLSITTGNEVGKLAYGTGDIPFVRTSDISNWAIKSDPKHLVSQELYDSLSAKQDVREGDILMVKDGSYLIGTCAMVTKYDTRIIFQSHLYKIRVRENNQYGLNRYYLLGALSSEFLKKQITANTYSCDIIDSLGNRLNDLVIPIPKNAEKLKQITTEICESIELNMRAKELAKHTCEKIGI